jgi:glycosyltransferase involved in cell wall biosynthesis
MSKIYWCVQQLDKIGGTEMVTIDLINHLCDYFDITLICSSKIVEPIVYKINPKVKIESLNIPNDIVRYDEYTRILLEKHQIFKFLKLTFRTLYYFVFHRNYYRRLNQKRMNQDDIYIGSSLDSYDYAPKHRRVFYHFHFNEVLFNSFSTQIYLKFFRKADKYIFLTKTTLELVKAKHHYLQNISTFAYNPIMYEYPLNLELHNHSILFCGRFHPQKDPIFALKIAQKLKEKNFSFTLNMYGDGSLKNEMLVFIKENKLEDNVKLFPMTTEIIKAYLSNDLLLISSTYEGFSLVRGEANAFSLPYISTNRGPSSIELCSEGRDGYVLEGRDPEVFADKIISILSDDKKFIEFKKTAHKESKKHSYKNIIPIWINEILK